MLRLSLTLFTGRALRWLLFQIASLADFLQVVPVADFFCQLARVRRWLLLQVALVVDFFLGCGCRWLLFQFAPLLTFFTGRACRWFFFQVARVRCWLLFQLAPVADFFHRSRPSLTFSKLCLSLTFLTVGTGTSLNSFSRCASRRFFFQVVPVAVFFCQLAPVTDIFPGRDRRCLFFQVTLVRCRFFSELRSFLTLIPS